MRHVEFDANHAHLGARELERPHGIAQATQVMRARVDESRTIRHELVGKNLGAPRR